MELHRYDGDCVGKCSFDRLSREEIFTRINRGAYKILGGAEIFERA